MPDAEDFYRIKRLPPYAFAEVNRLKADYRAAGRDIIDFGKGNPDMAAPARIVEKLVEAARQPRVLDEAEVAVAPGIGFGEYGEGYVRIAPVENEHRIRQAARSVRRLMLDADAVLGRYSQLRETSA